MGSCTLHRSVPCHTSCIYYAMTATFSWLPVFQGGIVLSLCILNLCLVLMLTDYRLGIVDKTDKKGKLQHSIHIILSIYKYK